MAKKVESKPKSSDIESKIKQDFIRRVSYMTSAENTVVFCPPEEHHMNSRLSNHKPLTCVDKNGNFKPGGRMGHVRKFYIPAQEHSDLQKIFESFEIPTHMWPDLTWAYLNMIFAACDATFSTESRKDHDRGRKELIETMQFLESLAKGNVQLRNVILDYGELPMNSAGHKKKSITGKITAKEHVSVRFFESLFQSFKENKNYEIIRSLCDSYIDGEKIPPFMGHMNAEAHYRCYYARAIFEYLDIHLYSEASEYMSDPEKYLKELKKLTRKYSRQQMFELIGRMMLLSGLLVMKDEPSRDDIIDNIEKKVDMKYVSKAWKK